MLLAHGDEAHSDGPPWALIVVVVVVVLVLVSAAIQRLRERRSETTDED